jgi:type IV pilus assembly protein PilY1
MKLETMRVLKKTIVVATLFCMTTQSTFATLLNLSNQPLFIGSNIPPMVMLTMSKDQQLFKKAYNDYSDLDLPQDGVLETTYKNTIKYYGYFDSTKCYDYVVANLRFEPFANADSSFYCVGANSGKWSGNFLNWLTMTRMDTVRKLLYGGLRSTDGVGAAGITVLERAYLPTDAHSFAKFYEGQINQATGAVTDNDVNRLTPFTALTTPPQTTSASTVAVPSAPTSFKGTLNTNTSVTAVSSTAGLQTGMLILAATSGINTGTRIQTIGAGSLTLSAAATASGARTLLTVQDATFNTTTTNYQVGHQVRLTATAGAAFTGGTVMYGTIISIAAGTSITVAIDRITGTSAVGANGTAWNIDNLSRTGITFCNTTLGGQTGPWGRDAIVENTVNARSQSNTNAPLMRVASGNYALWSAAERFQCLYQEEPTTTPARNNQFGPPIGQSLGTRSNGNRVGFSGLNAAAFEPTRAGNGLGEIDYIVRVQACVTGKLGEERCKQYPNGNYKPVGLLQEYGDVGLINFGLMTGSYSKNISGGVLRKNVSPFSQGASSEVNKDTDGTFIDPGVNGGIVKTMNAIRIIGYAYATTASPPTGNNSGTYRVAYPNGDNCDFQLTNIVEGSCRSWASPVSEIYFEALRYFAGKTSPTAEFNANDTTAVASGGPALANLVTAPWPATSLSVLNANNYCSPINILVFNASVSTNEDSGQIPTASTSMLDINSSQSVVALTKSVGDNEPGTERVGGSNQFFFGKAVGDTSANPGFELCSAKGAPATNGLGDVIGICPEGPTVGGTYHIAGLAYHARTTRLRPGTGADTLVIPATDTKSLKAATYGISLATNVPTLPIKVLGDTNPRAIIQPIYRLVRTTAPTGIGGGALVDLKFVSQTVTATASKGSVYLNWEDSEQGGDYDQDLWGILSWCLKLAGDTTVCPAAQPANTLAVTTQVVAESTNQQQGFGYTISGTTKDGPHFHSGIEDFNFCDTSNIFGILAPQTTVHNNTTDTCAIPLSSPATTLAGGAHGGGCKNCNVLDAATTATYTLSGTPAARNLRDPLWYAAKYGGFTDVDTSKDNIPNVTDEWDKRTSTGAQGADGIPDNYFLVTNPLGLVSALDRAFISILSNASASSVATNSTSLQTGTTIYQARFNANDWSGQVLAFKVNTTTGQIEPDPDWDAGQILNSQHSSSTVAPASTASSKVAADIASAGRTILTWNETSRQAVAFRWPESTAPQSNPTCPNPAAGVYGPGTVGVSMVDALNKDKYGNIDNRGCRRLEWIRGDQFHEGATVASFRQRPVSRLGDIVNSDPNFVAAPNAGFGDAAYAQFRQDWASRPAVVYVGGNDGMLHAFRASDGREILGYIPSKVFNKLSHLMDKTYTAALAHRYFVDASPEISDAFIRKGAVDSWRTVLVSGLGHGGQGLFALDITDPSQFSEATSASSDPTKIVLWEFNDSDDPNLGFVMGQPVIRKMANGKWAAIVSGGYNNQRGTTSEMPETDCTDSSAFPAVPSGCTRNSTVGGGRGYLFVVFLNGPTGPGKTWVHGIDYIRISSGIGGDNGLAQPLAADVNGDGVVDYIYAGDLKGNLHKFNVKNTDPLRWRDVTNREILFTATDGVTPQPITAKPEATLHPTGQGFIITFGTGKYLEVGDACPPGGCPAPPTLPVYQQQSFYGIWDKDDNPITSSQTVVTSKLQLLQQTIENVVSGASTFRIVSNLTPDWFTDPLTQSSPTKDLGWYMNFPTGTSTGERSVFRPILTSGRLIFTTLLPLTDACEFGGTSFLMVVDPTTGGRIEAAVLNTDSNPDLNTSDKVNDSSGVAQYASGVKSSIGITPTPTIIRAVGSTGSTENAQSQILGTSGPLLAGAGFLLAYALAAGSSGGNASTMIGLSASGGRVSWRELLN